MNINPYSLHIEKQNLEGKKFETFSCYSNGKQINSNEIQNSDINIYLGLLLKNNQKHYTSELILGTIKNSLKVTNQQVNIELGGELSQIMNNEIEQPGEILSIDEQKKYLIDILSTNLKQDDISRINIKTLSERHSEILNTLNNENGFKVDVKKLEEVRNQSFKHVSSLDIYRLLYLESKKNNKLLKLSANTQTKYLKEKRNERASYYGLAETAIRLKDLLDGKSVQGGETRQKRYDVIINKLLGKEYESEELNILYNFFDEAQINVNTFKQFYVNKKELENSNSNNLKLAQVKKRMNSLLLSILAGTTMVFGSGYSIKSHLTNIEQEKFEEKVNTIILNNFPNIPITHDSWMRENDFDLKKHDMMYLKANITDLTNTFLSLYDSNNHMGTNKNFQGIYHFILNDILNSKDFFKKNRGYYFEWSNLFLKKFIKNNKVKLIQEGFNIEVNNLSKYTNIIKDTAALDQKSTSNIDKNFAQHDVKIIGVYNVNYSNYEIGLVNINGTKFIVAKSIIGISSKIERISNLSSIYKLDFKLSEGHFFSKEISKYL